MLTTVSDFSQFIQQAKAVGHSLCIRGLGSKDFYGNPSQGQDLSTLSYRGIIDYEPTELVITARAGTPMREIESALKEKNQMLGFEAPYFSDQATLGGVIAAGLSGPRRPYAGAVRDLLLGIRMIDGHGSDLNFGGRVIKNVAGFDLSRLMAGSMGTLGLVLEASLKTVPLPAFELSLRQICSLKEAIERTNHWAGQALPLSASAWVANQLHIRLSGAESAVHSAALKLGGETIPFIQAQQLWTSLRDHTHSFFNDSRPLWRLSLRSTAGELNIEGEQLIEWGGAQRWVKTHQSASHLRQLASAHGGHATLFKGKAPPDGVFHPLSPALEKIHRQLKKTFDPAFLFNPGRLYPDSNL